MESQPDPSTRPVAAHRPTDQRDRTPSFDLAELRAKPMAELLAHAARVSLRAGADEPFDRDRRSLIFHLQQAIIAPDAVGRGAGILDLRPEGFAFLRGLEHDCQPGADDLYVSANQVRRLRLRPGQLVSGIIRPPRDGENYFAMLRIERIDGRLVSDKSPIVPFRYQIPILPRTRLPLGNHTNNPTARTIDLLAPLAFGQRVLIESPVDANRRTFLGALGGAIATGPDPVDVVILTIDQSPEGRATLDQTLPTDPPNGSTITTLATNFADDPSEQVHLVELVRARIQRLVETGRRVVLFLDSLTDAVRAYNATVSHSGRVVSAGLDAAALLPVKKLFALARQLEGNASLTIFATLIVDSESHRNRAIEEEFQGRANAIIRLRQDYNSTPAVSVQGTIAQSPQHSKSPTELAEWRSFLESLPENEGLALETILTAIADTPDNATLLARANGA